MIALVIVLILVAVLAAQILWAVLKRQPAARMPVAAACGLAAVGYLLTGHPLTPDRPAMPVPVDSIAVQAFADARRQSLTIAGDTSAWLTLAEALEAGGNTVDAVRTLNDAIDKSPRTPDLWIGLGAALVLHADGAMTPASRLAFARGESLAPRRPGLSQMRRLACARRHDTCAR